MAKQSTTTKKNNQQFTVGSADNENRLDKFLTAQIPEASRSKIQKWIEHGEVRVNGETVSKHFALTEGDTVVLNHEEQEVKLEKIDVPVLFEDEHIIVLKKPVGMLVHPTAISQEWTITHFLKEHCPGIEEVGDDPIRPGIIHRLDRPVSGVMVAAKTQEAFINMKHQFATRKVGKEYRAIVHGVPEKETDVIKFVIARSKTKGGKMAARPEHEEGRDAWTEYDVLRTSKNRYAELKVTIKTGRTHQIRAHLAAIDHPVVGDTLYTSKHYSSNKEYPRLFLHSHNIGFQHPETKEMVRFDSKIPSEFADFLTP